MMKMSMEEFNVIEGLEKMVEMEELTSEEQEEVNIVIEKLIKDFAPVFVNNEKDIRFLLNKLSRVNYEEELDEFFGSIRGVALLEEWQKLYEENEFDEEEA